MLWIGEFVSVLFQVKEENAKARLSPITLVYSAWLQIKKPNDLAYETCSTHVLCFAPHLVNNLHNFQALSSHQSRPMGMLNLLRPHIGRPRGKWKMLEWRWWRQRSQFKSMKTCWLLEMQGLEIWNRPGKFVHFHAKTLRRVAVYFLFCCNNQSMK